MSLFLLNMNYGSFLLFKLNDNGEHVHTLLMSDILGDQDFDEVLGKRLYIEAFVSETATGKVESKNYTNLHFVDTPFKFVWDQTLKYFKTNLPFDVKVGYISFYHYTPTPHTPRPTPHTPRSTPHTPRPTPTHPDLLLTHPHILNYSNLIMNYSPLYIFYTTYAHTPSISTIHSHTHPPLTHINKYIVSNPPIL